MSSAVRQPKSMSEILQFATFDQTAHGFGFYNTVEYCFGFQVHCLICYNCLKNQLMIARKALAKHAHSRSYG
jgi:hypothetical protein